MPQQDDGNVHLALSQLALLLFKTHRVLFVDIDIFIIRYNAKDWNAAEVFQHAASLVEQPHVATELVDDDALDESPILWRL